MFLLYHAGLRSRTMELKGIRMGFVRTFFPAAAPISSRNLCRRKVELPRGMKSSLIWCQVLVFFGCVMAGSAVADSFVLSDEALRRAVSGKTIYLSTGFGFELPILYRRDGTMVAKRSPLGILGESIGLKKDRGVWWIRDDRLCQRWKKWLDGKSVCFELKQSGKQVFWRSNTGGSGTARLVN